MSRVKILSSAFVELDTIEAVDTSSRTEIINSDNILSFTAPLTAENTDLFNDTNTIGLDDDYFDIAKYKKGQAESGELQVSVECEHVSYRLNNSDYDLEYFTETGTPTEILTALLAGTGFTVGTVEFTEAVTYSAQEKKSRRGLLVQFAEYLGGELLFNKFTVSILAQRGSTAPKDLMAGRNITVISKSVDKTTLDRNGNPTVAYECALIHPMELALGDVVTMAYATLGIDVTLRIVSITTNPYNKYEVSFSVSNTVPAVEDAAYEIQTTTVAKDALYNGCRIGPEFGFEAVRNDKKARSYFKSDGMAMQAGDGTGENWEDKLYYDFDPETGEAILVFDGLLSAQVIAALEAQFEVVISNTAITQTLTAQMATIAQLTVDRLDTSQKVQNYLSSDTSDVNFIRIYEQIIEFVTASTDGLTDEQATDRYGALLYWTDDTHAGTTTTETEYPVMVYVYDEAIKLSLTFDNASGVYVPKISLGEGSGLGDGYGVGYVYKGTDGLYIEYKNSQTGESCIIKLTDAGIDMTDFPTVAFADSVAISGGLVQIWVQPKIPSAAKVKDLWVDTDDYSRYDILALTEATTLLVSSNEFVTASGTFIITLHAATAAGIIKKIYNVGTGIITIAGTINGATNIYLYPGESVELITDGVGWRC